MGCAQSKIDNEEIVARCKNRKRYMKQAVASRNAFAAAHSSYAVALKHVGAALNEYGHGELAPTSFPPTLPSSSSAPTALPSATPLRPPPRPDFTPPLQRAASMPSIPAPKPLHKKIPQQPISEEAEADEDPAAGATTPVPPSPPPSVRSPTPPPPEHSGIGWDYFFSSGEHMPGPSLEVPTEEVHYNRAVNSAPAPEDVVAAVVDAAVAEEIVKEEGEEEMDGGMTPPEPLVRRKHGGVAQHQRTGSSGGGEGRKGKGGHVTANVNLVQLLVELDDRFLKASESAQEVTKMLEATRLHYHSNFADNRGHIDHSARVMKVITWNKSFKRMPGADDGKDDFDDEEWETHATVLDKMLAWEKKLHDEVKAGELMKNEYQKKVAQLERLKRHGASTEKLEKTKAAVSHMQTRCLVDMQSMDSTVSEIQRLRDEQLYVKLSALVDGLAKMWESMYTHHKSQLQVVSDLRALDISSTPKETTPQHFDRTEQLYRMSSDWHAHFRDFMNHQKDYVGALANWLKLNMTPIESNLREKVSSPPQIRNPPLLALINSWHEQIDKLPYDLAQSAISSFAAVINAVMVQQQEELKQKQKCEETRKELSKKERLFSEWCEKNPSGAPSEEAAETGGDGNRQDEAFVERRLVVDQVRKRLEDEEEELRKMCRQVREKAVGSLKSHLPELFRAITEFSFASLEMYKHLRSVTTMQGRSGPRKVPTASVL